MTLWLIDFHIVFSQTTIYGMVSVGIIKLYLCVVDKILRVPQLHKFTI